LSFVSDCVSFQAAPNCQPNFPIERDSVILVVNLAIQILAQIPTHLPVIFVSV